MGADVQEINRETLVSMGIIKVEELVDFKMEKIEAELQPRQLSLFEDIKELDPVPYTFKYRFKCADDKCKGHNLSIVDWEIGALYRTARQRGVAESDLFGYIAHNFVDVMFAPKKETYFYVGTLRFHPQSFIVGGVFYFDREP